MGSVSWGVRSGSLHRRSRTGCVDSSAPESSLATAHASILWQPVTRSRHSSRWSAPGVEPPARSTSNQQPIPVYWRITGWLGRMTTSSVSWPVPSAHSSPSSTSSTNMAGRRHRSSSPPRSGGHLCRAPRDGGRRCESPSPSCGRPGPAAGSGRAGRRRPGETTTASDSDRRRVGEHRARSVVVLELRLRSGHPTGTDIGSGILLLFS